MVKPQGFVDLCTEQLLPMHQKEAQRAKKIDTLLTGSPDDYRTLHADRGNKSEKLKLEGLSHTRLLDLIVEYTGQQLVAEGFSAPNDAKAMWAPFERAGFPSRQGAAWRAALNYGQAFGLALPGTQAGGGTAAYLRAFSPKRFGAVYADPVDDEFPLFAYRVIPQGGEVAQWRVYDDEGEHFLSYEAGSFKYLEGRAHDMGVCPVVQFSPDADTEGEVTGQPLKYERDKARHDKTVNDRLQIQHYNSWRIKYAIKMDEKWSEEDRKKFRLRLEQDDILIGDGDTEFGTLEQTDLNPMAKAQEMDRDTLAAVSQTPVWAFNGGSMVNLAAEALIEAKSGNRQKVWSIQRSLGRPLCAWGRLAALAEGRTEDAYRFDLQVDWADIGSLSMAAAADSLGKLAAQLGVPAEMLWELIPGISARKVEQWREYAEKHPQGDLAIAQALTRQVMPSGTDT